MHRLGALAILAWLPLVSIACSEEDTDDCNNPPTIGGTWSGTRTDDASGDGTLTLTFVQARCTLSGTWSSSFPGDLLPSGGSFDGSTDEREVAARLTGGACTLELTGTLIAEDRITGGYRNADCSATGGGTFSITRDAPAG